MLPFQGAYQIIPFYTQGVALGWDIPGFQPGKTSGFPRQIKTKRAGTNKHLILTGAFDYVDFQFKWSQIQWISIVIARYEAIHFRRHCEVRSNPLPPSLRGTKQSTSAVIARYEAIQGARSGLLHPPFSNDAP
ncbi:MAG: hypothetical protein LBS88_08500 [Tannerellaceae bacterium]|jgi:hypothetical protein|nr:hypothetical protein [Tannerellaceae bacterium]